MSEADLGMLRTHILFVQRELLKTDPTGRFDPIRRKTNTRPYHLPPINDWGKVDVDQFVVDSLYSDEVVVFPKMGGSDSDTCDGRAGSVMMKCASRGRSMLTKLGYLEEEKLFDEVCLNDVGRDIMIEYVSGEYRSVSRYEVIRTIPAWYIHVPNTL
jgi:hypothetical protein